MTKPLLLDTFCGAGGCSVGYYRAGFEVVGVDIEPQKNYPFEFHQADALEFIARHGKEFDVIHASPPCQKFTKAGAIHGNDHHKDLLTPTRKILNEIGKPWVIENVPNAPMRVDVMLCGSMFGLVAKDGRLQRHRWFELWIPELFLTPPCIHTGPTISVFGHGGHIYHGVDSWRSVMDIDWMTRDELSQAIPPAYTEWLGRQLLERMNGK